MWANIRKRLRRRKDGEATDLNDAEEVPALTSGAIAALPMAPDRIIDLRDGDDDGSDRSSRSMPVAVLAGALTVDVVANGQDPSADNGPATPPEVSFEEVDPEAHIAATAVLAADLIADFAARTEGLREQIEVEQRRSAAALHRATDLSVALVAAAQVRAAEIREASARQQQDASERLEIAIEVLDRARAQADEIIDLAQLAASEIQIAADLDRRASERALADVDRERQELVAGARETARLVVEDLKDRLAALEGQLQAQASDLLRTTSAERNNPAPVDEIDRRLAMAVERALSEV